MLKSENGNINSLENWTEIIRPKTSFLNLGLSDLWKYKDLIFLFVRRDFVSQYKQTILGPLWHIIQPLLITGIFTFVFGNVAKLSTEGVPGFLFYMSGVTLWSYFSQTLTSTANTFVNNSQLFGKVYFPRLTVPISISISSFISFSIQLVLFLIFYGWFVLRGSNLHLNLWFLALPWLMFIMALWSLGLGIIISSMTTKYQDLRHVITLGVQIYMYVSPVVYPVSSLNENLRFWVMLNPVAPVLQCFRYAVFGVEYCSVYYLVLSTITSIVVFAAGLLIFNRVEKTFMDTV